VRLKLSCLPPRPPPNGLGASLPGPSVPALRLPLRWTGLSRTLVGGSGSRSGSSSGSLPCPACQYVLFFTSSLKASYSRTQELVEVLPTQAKLANAFERGCHRECRSRSHDLLRTRCTRGHRTYLARNLTTHDGACHEQKRPMFDVMLDVGTEVKLSASARRLLDKRNAVVQVFRKG